MAGSARALVHCFRCVYTWRPRGHRVRICPRCKSKLWNVPRIKPKSMRPTGLGTDKIIQPHIRRIRPLAARFEVSRIRVFGSVARGEATAVSDVDLLFESETPLGLLRRAEFKEELETILGRSVDLCREESLKWYVRAQALADAVAL
ncbi:MAG: nucleotidyltransferase family protein [Thermoplasmata archaeon]